MERIVRVFLWCAVFLTACRADDPQEVAPQGAAGGLSFRLGYAAFEGEETRSGQPQAADYDRVEFCVVDGSGEVVPGVKGRYDAASSEMRIEGLREGDFRLMILGIRGDADKDGVTVRPVRNIGDAWLSFPEELSKPLEAEYFYSQTPLSVVADRGPSGIELSATVEGPIVQRRIIGRTDFSVEFNNTYVKTALLSQRVTLESSSFRTGLTAGGEFVGSGAAPDIELDLDEATTWLFPPTADGKPLRGRVGVSTRSYRGHSVARNYGFELEPLAPNRIGRVRVRVVHPDDASAVAFVTERAFGKFGLGYILQDGEPKEVYTDGAQRSFNTAKPLQVSVTGEGRLHVRFYSPRELSGVLIRARVPAVGDEFFDVAYFDRIPPFADFFGELPLSVRNSLCRTVSGRWVEAGPLLPEAWRQAEFRVESEDPYWAKLSAIKHGWNIGFDLYGGDPDRADGGPNGNWMGIRPVHCREVVALFLNFTYMIDMPEHEQILRENADRLYGNGGPSDKISVETVLSQMRQPRSLKVGLVYTGNGVLGLGGGSTFGAYQQAWFQHYFNDYSCEIMFHELGHVMGYSHSSSFTYGPWAQELMNKFYVKNIGKMPIDSPSYLNSEQNPNRYF